MQTTNPRKKNAITISVPKPLGFKILKRQESKTNKTYNIQTTDFSVGFIFAGSKAIHASQKDITICEGEIFALGSGSYYAKDFTNSSDNFCETIITIPMLTLKSIVDIIPSIPSSISYSFSKIATSQAPEQLQKVMKELSEFDNISDNLAYIKLCELICLLSELENMQFRNIITSEANSRLAKFSKIVSDSIYQPCTVADLAQKENMSISAFKSHFKAIFGQSPHAWLISQRLEHAKILLLTTDKSVLEIGSECGFVRCSHFSKLFKQQFLYPPYKFKQLQIKLNNKQH